MKRLSAALAASLILVLGACGQANDQQASQSPAPAAATESPPAPAATPAPAAAPEPAAAPAEAAAASAVSESAGTQDGAGSSLGKDIELATPAPVAPAEWKFREGAHYRALPAAQGTSSSPGKVEVAEVFWYGCPHCYDLEPVIDEWAGRHTSEVNFVRIPVMWSPAHEIHARVFYTAQALGKLDQIHPAVFRAFHIEQNTLQDEDDIRALFGKFGVSAEDFDKTFRSFAVDSQLQRARTLMTRYRVKAVPLLVVNGKYVTDGPEIKTRDQQLELVDELVLKERLKL